MRTLIKFRFWLEVDGFAFAWAVAHWKVRAGRHSGRHPTPNSHVSENRHVRLPLYLLSVRCLDRPHAQEMVVGNGRRAVPPVPPCIVVPISDSVVLKVDRYEGRLCNEDGNVR